MGKDDGDKYRLTLGYRLILVGIFLVAGLILLLVFFAESYTTTDITSIVGILTGVLGTLIGTFFGVQAGAEGKADALRRARTSEGLYVALATLAPEKVEEAKTKYANTLG